MSADRKDPPSAPLDRTVPPPGAAHGGGAGSAPTLPSAGATPAAPSASEDLTGQLLGGKYRVLRLLGEGGFGAVYEASDELLGAHVAIKVLRAQASEQSDALQRFLGEARVLTALDHPNVVRWITFDRTPQGLHYFVMEFLRGRELSTILEREGRLAHKRAIALLQQVLSALRAAHNLPDGRALLHLDLKPRNVFVVDGDPEQAKVIDFGMSQHVGAAARGHGQSKRAATSDLGATISGRGGDGRQHGKPVRRALGGTLLYASPEQIRHLTGDPEIVELDGRADLYSFGVMAFEMLAGRLPFPCTSYEEAVRAQLEQAPPKLCGLVKQLPRGLEAFVERCLHKDREQRFADVKAAQAALDQIAHPPSRWPLFAAALALLAALAVWLAWPERKPDPLAVAAPGGAIFVSPERPTANLPLRGLLAELRGAPVQFVTDPQDDADALPGWRATLLEHDGALQLALAAPAGAALLDQRDLHVRVGTRARGQFSAPLRVVHLPVDAWQILAAEVRGAQGRAVDPHGARFEVALPLHARDWLDKVEVQAAGETRVASLDPSRQDRAVYAVELAALGLGAHTGDAALRVAALDRAGHRVEQAAALRLLPQPLALSADLQGCVATVPGERYVAYPGSAPRLSWSSDRDVEVRVSARDEHGQELKVQLGTRDATLELPARAQSYACTIELTADDAPSTFHADRARGRAQRTLHLRYESKPVGLSVTPRRGSQTLPRAGDTWLAREAEVTLELQRDPDVPVTLRIDAGEATPREIELHAQTRASATLPLRDGDNRIVVSAHRYPGPGVPLPPEPEQREELRVRRDGVAPTLELTTRPAAVVKQFAAEAPCLAATLRDGDDPAPSLLWSLARGGQEQARGTSHGTLLWRELCGERDAVDGDCTLTLRARDAAGNESQAQSVTFTLARRGPDITLVAPSEPIWQPRAGNAFGVTLEVADPNGIAAVSCTLTAEDGSAVPTLVLRSQQAEAVAARFAGEFRLPLAWAQRRVQLVGIAVDTHGNEARTRAFAAALPAFELQREARIELEVTGSPQAPQPMRLVRGQRGYVFGGRADESEALRAIGFTGRLDVESRTEDLSDYYLDEAEVTVAQFLAFVADPAGYRNAAHWRSAQPDAARQRELQAQLAAQDGALPVTAIDWFEADAYARYVGKRLPSDIEWEYAVRGGTAYRACSCAGPGFDPSKLHVRRGAGAGPQPAALSVDLTPAGVAHGLRDLCSNVTEWTSASGRNDRRRAVGASFQHESFHFAIAELLAPTTRRAHIGLRCALSATDLDVLLAQPGRVRVALPQTTSPGR